MHFSKKLSTGIVCLALSAAAYGKKLPASPVTDTGFALIELYTSEGCSSCPAAEAALSQVSDAGHPHVYVLEFHVNYWDYIGWKDMFSSADYTLRQQQYVTHFKLGSAYTPQAVVNGKNELVGSDKEKLNRLINDGLHTKPAAVLHLSAKENGNSVAVTYTSAHTEGQSLNIALVQKHAETNVKRGENSGRKLKHMNVVRSFTTVNAGEKGTVSLSLPQGLTAADCTVIAFTQQQQALGITAAAQTGIN